MRCSTVTLSLATVISVIGIALFAIVFGIDNWLEIHVWRLNIQKHLNRYADAKTELDSKYYYYTRSVGLFRMCFPKERPTEVNTYYLSILDTYCLNINYYAPEENNVTKDFAEDPWATLHMGGYMVILFVIACVAILAALCTGVKGCRKKSPGMIAITATLLLLTCLLVGGIVGLFEYYEKEKKFNFENYDLWRNVQDNTEVYFDWSYLLAKVGIQWSMVAAVLLYGAAVCLRREQKSKEVSSMPGHPQKQGSPLEAVVFVNPAGDTTVPLVQRRNFPTIRKCIQNV